MLLINIGILISKGQSSVSSNQPLLSFYWSNEPRLKEILRRTSSHEECRKHLKSVNEINVKDSEQMSRLCLYQEQEMAEKAHFKMNREAFRLTLKSFSSSLKRS